MGHFPIQTAPLPDFSFSFPSPSLHPHILIPHHKPCPVIGSEEIMVTD